MHDVVVVVALPDAVERAPAAVVACDVAVAARSASAAPGGDYLPFALPRGVGSAGDTGSHGTPAAAAAAAGSEGSHWDAVPDDTHPACSGAAATTPPQSVAGSPPGASARTPDTPRACTAARYPPCPTSGPAGTRPASSAR